MGDLETVIGTLTAGGLDADSILASTQNPVVKQTLIDNTDSAVQRGLFGAPTMFVDGEMFFGQDRLQFIEIALQTKI